MTKLIWEEASCSMHIIPHDDFICWLKLNALSIEITDSYIPHVTVFIYVLWNIRNLEVFQNATFLPIFAITHAISQASKWYFLASPTVIS